MNAEKDVASTKNPSAGEESVHVSVLRPAVDIFEGSNAISLIANLPGVEERGLTLEVADKTLTIRGDIQIDMPAQIEPGHAEVYSTRYQRAFTLSDELDAGSIQASLKDGLLSVTIPKREDIRSRRIEVSSG